MTSGYLNNANIRGSKGYTPWIQNTDQNTSHTILYKVDPSGSSHAGFNIYRNQQTSVGSLGLPKLSQLEDFSFSVNSSHFPTYSSPTNIDVNMWDPFTKTNFNMRLQVSMSASASTGGSQSFNIHNAWIQNSSGSYNHPYSGFKVGVSPEAISFPISITGTTGTTMTVTFTFPSVFTYNSISRPAPVVNKFNVRGSSYLVNTTKYNANVRGTKNYFWV